MRVSQPGSPRQYMPVGGGQSLRFGHERRVWELYLHDCATLVDE